MPTYSFRLPPGAPILEMLSELPATIKPYIRQGLHLLAELDPQLYPDLLKLIAQSLDSPHAVAEEQLAARFGQSPRQVGQMVAAATLLSSVVATQEHSLEEFLSAAAEAQILDTRQQAGVRRFLQAAESSRTALKKASERARIASRVLPSLTTFETTIDLRISFERGTVAVGVPVVVALIDTDAPHERLWLQFSRGQAERLIEDLQTVVRQLDEVERWADAALDTSREGR